MISCMVTTKHVTTREARELLGSGVRSDAIALLRGAAVPHVRVGSAYLWDRAAVESLAASLQRFVVENSAQSSGDPS